ncbi:MAG TPA: PQQ-binding-like beta-propeller repeat protein [Verrucomicrobiae bacterium]|nr:PQQ-binding-like beta-propeller repeat protein [Verrucomicrobiae bacterium]
MNAARPRFSTRITAEVRGARRLFPFSFSPDIRLRPLAILAASTGLVMALATAPVQAGDWPQFLGPTRDGRYDGPKLNESWPAEGPKVLWKRPVGHAFAGPAVADGKVILFHRVEDREVVEALDAVSGKALWKFDYATAYQDDFGFDDGPRATPTIAGGRIYSFGAEGSLHCLDLATGKNVWEVDTKARYAAGKGFFGLVCAPLVEGDAVLLNIGGRDGAGIVAFHKDTGKLLWKATDDEASYSSPVAATLNGKRAAVFFTRAGLVVLDPATGTVRSRFTWRSRMGASVNAAAPIVVGDDIFLTASYQTGAVLLHATEGSLQKVWSGDQSLSSHYATSVYRDGFLYGYDGRQEMGPSLRCIEFKTGKVRWTQEGFGAGTVILAGDRMLLMKEDGNVVLAAASPDKYQQLASAQVLGRGVRPYPALADGRFYARDTKNLVCLELISKP